MVNAHENRHNGILTTGMAGVFLSFLKDILALALIVNKVASSTCNGYTVTPDFGTNSGAFGFNLLLTIIEC